MGIGYKLLPKKINPALFPDFLCSKLNLNVTPGCIKSGRLCKVHGPLATGFYKKKLRDGSRSFFLYKIFIRRSNEQLTGHSSDCY
jgi:hypothetical protein